MKKIWIFLTLLFLTGCASNQLQKEYDIYLNELKNTSESSIISNYNIKVNLDKLTDDEVVYQVVIDEAKYELNNIKVLVYHDQKTEDVFPSIGMFDGSYNLVNTESNGNNTLGINLVGYIPFNGNLNDFKPTIKVMVLYNLNNELKKDIYIYKFDNNV